MKRKAIAIGIGAALLSAAAWAHWGGGLGAGYGGMMGGYGMGPGMMGGYGMGPGMMGGYGGGGPGYCYGYGRGDFSALGLTDEQRDKIATIQREAWESQSKLMDRMHELAWNRSDNDRFSEADARKAYEEMSNLRQKMFEASLDARKRVESVLTAEQKRKLAAGG